MLEQIILKEQLDLEARANDSFLNDLLTEKASTHEDLFVNRQTHDAAHTAPDVVRVVLVVGRKNRGLRRVFADEPRDHLL